MKTAEKNSLPMATAAENIAAMSVILNTGLGAVESRAYEPPSILHHLLLHRWVVNEPRK